MDKLKIIIAGPGAGKTYNLKNEVINCFKYLLHKFFNFLFARRLSCKQRGEKNSN